MHRPTLKLTRFNGVEVYSICDAEYNIYETDGEVEAIFKVLTAGEPLQSLPDTEDLRANPSIEIGFRIRNVTLGDFSAGDLFNEIPAYDEFREEWMTNIYYCSHEGIENVEVEVIAATSDSIEARIFGSTNDPNYYDGSKPPTAIEVIADFTKNKSLRKSFS